MSADEKKTLKVNAPKDVDAEETTGKNIMDLILFYQIKVDPKHFRADWAE